MTVAIAAGTELTQLREQLAHYARRTHERGYVAATDGNLSARTTRGVFLISPSGSSLGELEPEDFVAIDARGELVEIDRGLRPSSEFRMHLAIYEERADVHAVLHAHPPVTIGFSIAGHSLAGCVLPEVVVGLGTIPTLSYTTPTTPETAAAVRKMIRRRDALILEHHGTVTVGDTIRIAYHRLEKVEHTAQITLVARQLGRVRQLPPAEVERLLRMREKLGLPPVVPHCNDCGVGCI